MEQINCQEGLTTAVFTRSEAADFTEMERLLPRSAQEAVSHIHPLQSIELHALDGKLGIILPDRRLIIQPGTSFQVPRNVEHALYNADEKPIRFKSKWMPALHVEWLSKEMNAVRQRKNSRFRTFLEHSYILSQVRGEYYSSGLPVLIQKWLHPIVAGIARFMGVHKSIRPVY